MAKLEYFISNGFIMKLNLAGLDSYFPFQPNPIVRNLLTARSAPVLKNINIAPFHTPINLFYYFAFLLQHLSITHA